jgi:hypothetical protein
MRRVFRRLCDEHPEETETVEQRDTVASAEVIEYDVSTYDGI